MDKTISDEVIESVDNLSEAEIDYKKVEDAGFKAAEDVFGDKVDKDKAGKVIKGIIGKMKKGDIKVETTKDAMGVIANAFR